MILIREQHYQDLQVPSTQQRLINDKFIILMLDITLEHKYEAQAGNLHLSFHLSLLHFVLLMPIAQVFLIYPICYPLLPSIN